MPALFRIARHSLPQGQDWEPLDRVAGRDGVRLTEAGVTDIDIRIFPVEDRDVIYSLLVQSPSAGTNPNVRVFDTLQTDGRWKPDAIGYNLRILLPWADFVTASFWPEGGRIYRVEITLNSTGFNDIVLIHEYKMEAVWYLKDTT